VDVAPRYVLVLGRGRSGTTWLAAILNTSEECCYKAEPFPKSPYREWFESLESAPIDVSRARFLELCRHSHLGVDHRTNYTKPFYRRNPFLARVARYGARRIRLVEPLYTSYGSYALTPETTVLIKDVTLTLPPRCFSLDRLCETLQPTLVAIFRSPFANVASFLRGRKMGVFDAKRTRQQKIANLRALLDAEPESHLAIGRQLYREYESRLEEMSEAAFEALRWRMEVEMLDAFVSRYEKGAVVWHEELCTDPVETSRRLFAFAGLRFTDRTSRFLRSDRESGADDASREYYGIAKNSELQMYKWKTQLSEDEVRDITQIVAASPLNGRWEPARVGGHGSVEQRASISGSTTSLHSPPSTEGARR
jgi:hypothetical protein